MAWFEVFNIFASGEILPHWTIFNDLIMCFHYEFILVTWQSFNLIAWLGLPHWAIFFYLLTCFQDKVILVEFLSHISITFMIWSVKESYINDRWMVDFCQFESSVRANQK